MGEMELEKNSISMSYDLCGIKNTIGIYNGPAIAYQYGQYQHYRYGFNQLAYE
jgi:hypothetical protein